MKYITKILLIFAILTLTAGSISAQVITIDQKIILISNSYQVGGDFIIGFQIKGSNLTSARTLASLNADLVYDSSLIRFVSCSEWLPNLSADSGYSKSVTNNYNSEWSTKSIRTFITGPNVNSDNSNIVKGYDIPSSFTTLVKLNFIILDVSKPVTILVKAMTNQAGLFTYANNFPNTFDINNISLSEPENLVDTPMPVEFLNFAYKLSGCNVKLNWETASEVNNKGFQIQRKIITDGGWNVIGFVDGAGNSNVEKKYSFDDKKLNTGKYQYRIKQIDVNGNFAYHNLNGEVEIGLPARYNLTQNYPNPFNPVTKIDFDLPMDSRVRLGVYDITGRELMTLVNEARTAGFYTVLFNAYSLSSGTYFYRIEATGIGNTYLMTKKMTLIK